MKNIKTFVQMRTTAYLKQLIIISLVAFMGFGCMDNEPEIEKLPSAAVAFTYEVVDNTYQLDYYVGATIEFKSISSLEGICVWDFGDGTPTITGNVVTHKFTTDGTFQVKLTVANSEFNTKPILIKDIVPIMTVGEIDGGICEVLSTPVSILVELPNPENLAEEFLWIFPLGTTDENGNTIMNSTARDPGKLKFSHVGSQAVRLQTKLGGRQLQEGRVNVQVAYNQAEPTLYYAVKGGNIMALKLVSNKPAGMNINPFDMGISSGKRPLNILFNNASLYIIDAGQQFTFVNDENGNLGDGRIMVMEKDGSKLETMLTNTGHAFNDPFYGFIEGSILHFANRNTGISRINLTDRNRSYNASEFPWFVQNATLGYYNNGWSFGSMNSNFTKVNDTWYWCKTFNGTGIFRFKESDILAAPITGGQPAPTSGVTLSGMAPKSLVWDSKNQVIYFTILDVGFEGLYRCTLDQLSTIGGSRSNLAPYKLLTTNGKTVTPITEPGKGEGSTGEFIGISQLALDQATGCVYFGLRSAIPTEVKSGLMRYNPAIQRIEHVIEGVEVFGVAVNNNKSKLF